MRVHGLSADDIQLCRRVFRQADPVLSQDDFNRLAALGIVTHSVHPEWTAKGDQVFQTLMLQRTGKGWYAVFTAGRLRARHLDYATAIADFQDRCMTVKRARIEFRREYGSMEAVAFYRDGQVEWCNGWPERATKDPSP